MKAPKLATCLLNLLEELTRSKLKYHTGNKFDELVQSNLVGAHQISDADFKTHHSYADLRAAMKSAENDGLVHLRHQFDGFFRVDKPLGSQSWPDCLLVEGSVALGMEYKASKNGQPVWNSGLPKSRGLYLVHATGGEKLDVRTTYFLGGGTS